MVLTALATRMGFNPRSPRGGATLVPRLPHTLNGVSIHAPREGERRAKGVIESKWNLFQSTLPARESDI